MCPFTTKPTIVSSFQSCTLIYIIAIKIILVQVSSFTSIFITTPLLLTKKINEKIELPGHPFNPIWKQNTKIESSHAYWCTNLRSNSRLYSHSSNNANLENNISASTNLPFDNESTYATNFHSLLQHQIESIFNFNEESKDKSFASSSISDLPIFDVIPEINKNLKRKPNLLLEAPPGAGKTTIVPLALLTCPPLSNTSNDEIKKNENKINHIIVVEPRRMATKSASQRMSKLLQSTSKSSSISLSSAIGYMIRGDVQISSSTRITVMTDGILLNKLTSDPELSNIDIIIFDEFHERGVNMDTALALCCECQRQLRPDLRLIVMSATLLGNVNDSYDQIKDETMKKNQNMASKLMNVLGGNDQCDIIRSDGRQYPIDIQYWTGTQRQRKQTLPPLAAFMTNQKLLIDTVTDAIMDALTMAPSDGDILVFLPGVREIRKVIQQLTNVHHDHPKLDMVEILPLYGALPKEEQDYVIFSKHNRNNNHNNNHNHNPRRRIIVSSPIAEASLTLDGVTCVIDSGLRREPRCDVDTGMPRLITVRCSQASADQRAGRAGRTQPGLCLRLYSPLEYDTKFESQSSPEILSTDLTPTSLLLSEWGCSSPDEIFNDMPFVDAPSMDLLHKSFQLLQDLDALETIPSVSTTVTSSNQNNDIKPRYRITSHGRNIVKIPTHPRLATAIAKAKDSLSLTVAIATAVILDDELGMRRGRDDPNLKNQVQHMISSTPSSRMGRNMLQYASRVGGKDAKASVLSVMEKCYQNDSFQENVLKNLGPSLLPGFIDLVAQRKGDASYSSSMYSLSLGRSARLDGIQKDAPDFAVILDTTTGDDGKTRIRSFVSIDYETLLEVAKEKTTVFTVPSRGHEVRARRVLQVGSIELSSTPIPSPPPEKISEVLLDTIRSLGGVYPALLESLPPKKQNEIKELRERIRATVKYGEEDESELWKQFIALDAEENKMSTEKDKQILEALVEPWLAPAGSLKNLNFIDALLSSIPTQQLQQLNNDFPVQIQASDGTSVPLSYVDGTPTASAKLQQFFGTTTSPCVGPKNNHIPVTLSLLSPAGKVLAKTSDLPFFWKEVYPSIRAEMRGRYSKHPWPEDPMNANPTRLTNKQVNASLENNDQKVENKKGKKGKKKKR